MNRIAALAASVLLSAAGLAVANPAWADNDKCPENRFCLFEDDDFQGGRAIFSGNRADLNWKYWDGADRPVQNGASSMINNTSHSVILYSDAGSTVADCGGDSYLATPESEDEDFTNNGYDNEASCVDY